LKIPILVLKLMVIEDYLIRFSLFRRRRGFE